MEAPAVPMEAKLKRPKNNPALNAITEEEYLRVANDPVYFLDNYGWTFDPRVPPYHFPFRLYGFQKDYIRQLQGYVERGENVMTEKSRDMGASWCTLGLLLWYWLFVPGSQILLGSRKEDYVDNGTVDSLFGKLDYLMDRNPFCPKGYRPPKHRTSLKMVNPMNGNVIKGESANAEFSRSGRYKCVFMDEIAFWETADTAWAAAGESTPCIIATTTPPKKPHFAKALRLSGIVKVITLHWRLHPLKDDAWYANAKATKTAEDLAREVDINWEGSITGRYYPETEHVRVGEFPYVPTWPLWVSHDPGHFPDPHAIGWFQINPENGRFRLIESMERTNKRIAWYAPFFGLQINSEMAYNDEDLRLIGVTKEWKKGIHVGDPAGKIRNEETGRSVYTALSQDYDIQVNTNDKMNEHYDRRTAAAHILMRLDVNETPNNRYWLECMRNSRLPEVPVGSQRTTENDKPIHDWTSHLRSMTEYFAVNVDWEPQVLDLQQRTFQKLMAEVQLKNRTGAYLGSRN